MMEILKSLVKSVCRVGEEGLRTHQAVLRLLGRVPRGAGPLLDIGCGSGEKTLAYGRLLGLGSGDLSGVDLLHSGAVSARFESFGSDLERDPFPFPDASFSVVVCNQVLEHLKNIFLPLSEMERVLRPGGYLLIGIPNLAALHNRFLLLLGRQPACNDIRGPHVRCFSHAAFLDFLKSNPSFDLAGTDSATLYPFPYPLVDWLGRLFPGPAAVTFYLLRKKEGAGFSGWSAQAGVDSCFG